MKKILSLVTLFVIIFTAALVVQIPYLQKVHAETSAPQLIITEVSSSVVSDEEWIEIYNYGTTAVTFSDLTFFENDTNHGISSFTGETQLEPQTIAIIANKADIVKSKNPNYSGIILDSTWASLTESGESIGIKIKGVFADKATYGSSSKEQTAERTSTLSSDWVAGPATIGTLSEMQKQFLTNTPTETTQTPAAGIENNTSTDEIESPEEPLVSEETASDTNTDVHEYSAPQTAQSTSTTTTSTTETVAATLTTLTTTQATSTQTTTNTQPNQTASTATYLPNSTTQIITNSPPVARITVQSGQLTAQEKTSINFDGRTSYDPNNDQLRFDWDFGDGTNATTANPGVHTFSKAGTYTIQLTVTDTTGLKSVAYSQVQVLAKSTNATGASSAPATEGTTKTMTTAASSNTIVLETTGPTEISPTNKSTEKITITVTAQQAKELFNTYSQASTTARSSAQSNEFNTRSTESNTTPRGIIINELFPAPEKGDSEWIELHNTESVAVGLSGMLLADASKLKKPFTLPNGAVIPPHGFVIITGEQSKISLNNSEDVVYLASPTGTLIDSVKYTGGKRALAFARALDGSKSVWSWTNDITRGKENPSLSTIAGTVTNVGTKKQNGKATPFIEIQTSDSEVHTVMTDDADKDADITNGFFNEGDTVSIAAFEAADGSEHLSSVKKIETPQNIAAQNSKESSFTKTQLIVAAACIIAINAITIMYFVRGFAPRQSDYESEQDLLA